MHPKSSYGKGVTASSAMAAGIQLSGLSVLFLAQALAAKWALSKSDFGAYAQCRGWVPLLGTVAIWGLPLAALRFSSEYKHAENIACISAFWQFARRWILVTTVPTTLVFFSFSAIAWNGNESWVMMLGSMGIALFAIMQTLMQTLRGIGKLIASIAPVTLLHPAAFLALIFACHLCEFELTGIKLTLVYLLSMVMIVLFQSFLLSKEVASSKCYRCESLDEKKSLWKQAMPQLGMSQAAATVIRESDLVIVGLVCGADDAAVYLAASRGARLASSCLPAVVASTGPRFVAAQKEMNTLKLQLLLQKSALMLCSFALIVGTLLALFSDKLLGLFGPSFLSGQSVMRLLIVGQIINSCTGPVGLLLNVTGNQDAAAKTYCLFAGVQVASNFVFAYWFGPVGAACSTAISYSICSFTLAYQVHRHLEISLFGRHRNADSSDHTEV